MAAKNAREPLTDRASCDSMTHVIHRLLADNRISACFTQGVVEWPELAAPNWRLRWDAGRLWIVHQRREAMYFHFHGFKRQPGYRQPCGVEGDSVFEMSAHGFDARLSYPLCGEINFRTTTPTR